MIMIQKTIRVFQVLVIGLISVILAYPLIIAINYHLVFRNKIYPKIKVVGFDLSGKTKEEGLALLKKKVEEEGLNSLIIEYQDKKWEINLADFKFQYLPQKTIESAYNLGRSKDLGEDMVAKWKIWRQGANLNLDYQLEQSLEKEKIATIAALINIPLIPPTIEIKTLPLKDIEIKQGKAGRTVNEKKLLQLIDERISQLNQEKILLPIEDISSKITPEQAEQTKERAKKLLDKKVKLSFKKDQWELQDKEIINFLDFEGGFDQPKIASYTAQLAKSTDRPPQNALFNFRQGKVTGFKPAIDGQKLDQERTVELLVDAFNGLEKEKNEIALVSLPIALTKPEIATEEVNNLGIKELIGKGESWFRGSISSRIHNIKLASQKLNGILIPPGETFNFNKVLGDVSAQTGFKQAYIIKDGRTVLGDGGGVCQVSTTLFRAVLKAGLPIIERRAHAYRVYYYEQNYQTGIDATVFDPTADLKFKNDTSAHILIQSYIDIPNYKLTFDLFGTGDGRKITISPSRMWDQTPPPPDLYQDDPTLPVGAVKQVDWKSWGAKVAFDWKVVRGNEVLQERVFYSHYRPWQAVFLRGTGGQ